MTSLTLPPCRTNPCSRRPSIVGGIHSARSMPDSSRVYSLAQKEAALFLPNPWSSVFASCFPIRGPSNHLCPFDCPTEAAEVADLCFCPSQLQRAEFRHCTGVPSNPPAPFALRWRPGRGGEKWAYTSKCRHSNPLLQRNPCTNLLDYSVSVYNLDMVQGDRGRSSLAPLVLDRLSGILGGTWGHLTPTPLWNLHLCFSVSCEIKTDNILLWI